MSAYVSPLFQRDSEGQVPGSLVNQPIYSCPRCKTAFLMLDLFSAELIQSKELHSPKNRIHASLRFWPCLTCGATLFASKVSLKDSGNLPLRARIETAIQEIYAQSRNEAHSRLAIPAILRKVEQLLDQVELSTS